MFYCICKFLIEEASRVLIPKLEKLPLRLEVHHQDIIVNDHNEEKCDLLDCSPLVHDLIKLPSCVFLPVQHLFLIAGYVLEEEIDSFLVGIPVCLINQMISDVVCDEVADERNLKVAFVYRIITNNLD